MIFAFQGLEGEIKIWLVSFYLSLSVNYSELKLCIPELAHLIAEELDANVSQEPSNVDKIMEIDEHIGCTMSGLIANTRTLVEHTRVETQIFPINVKGLAGSLVNWIIIYSFNFLML